MLCYAELTESDAVISLCSLRGNNYAYSLINGEVGVYGGSERFWRIKVSGLFQVTISPLFLSTLSPLLSSLLPPPSPPPPPLSQSKSQPMCLFSYDMNDDGVPELVTGWSSGKVDIRSTQTGNVIYKDTFSTHIAGVVEVGVARCRGG